MQSQILFDAFSHNHLREKYPRQTTIQGNIFYNMQVWIYTVSIKLPTAWIITRALDARVVGNSKLKSD